MASKRKGPAVPVGTLVTFTLDKLGASRLDELHCCTEEVYGVGDSGVVAFAHPNAKALPDWFYVEVPSKAAPGALRYVGATRTMVEIVPDQTPGGIAYRARYVKVPA